MSIATNNNNINTSKLCRGATGVVACLHQQGVTHPWSWVPTNPCKNRTKTRREKGGQTTFTTPSKDNREPRHKTYSNAKRSSKANQSKKESPRLDLRLRRYRRYGAEGLDMAGIRFQRSESVLWASAVENTLSRAESVFWACGRQNTPSGQGSALWARGDGNTLSLWGKRTPGSAPPLDLGRARSSVARATYKGGTPVGAFPCLLPLSPE